MKTLNRFLILIALVLLSFSCSENDSLHSDKEKGDVFDSGLVDFSEVPQVAIVKKIDAVIQQAIGESWSKAEWIKRFGSPRRENSYEDDLEFIQYYDTGPFEDTSKELISGITIKLRSDRTFDYSYRTTSFGLPDYMK